MKKVTIKWRRWRQTELLRHLLRHRSATASALKCMTISTLTGMLLLVVAFPRSYALQESKLKWKVKDIIFEGNTVFSERMLKKVMLTKQSSRWSSRYYYKHLFRDDINALLLLYHNKGYLEAEISGYPIHQDSLKYEMSLKIIIKEGEQTRVAGISFFGNKVFSDEQLLGLLKLKLNQPFNKTQLEKDNYNLLSYYAQKGYIDARIEPDLKLNQQTHQIFIDFNIEEGELIHVGQIFIEGHEKTRSYVIKRELLFKPGSVYDLSKILESQQRLYQTGLFNSVHIKPLKTTANDPHVRDILIELVEKENGEVNLGVGFGSVDRLRGSLEVFQNNFKGLGKQLGLRLQTSFIVQKLEFSFTDPWLFLSHTKGDVNAFAERREEPNYDLQKFGGKLTLGKSFAPFSKIMLSYKYEDVTLSHVQGIPLIEDSKGNTRSLRLSLVRDSRDNQFNTTAGSYFTIELESAGSFLRGTNTFVKLTSEARLFHPLQVPLPMIFATSIRMGWMENFGRSKEVPLNERFYAGGEGSIRGFDPRQVGPKGSDNVPVGGKIKLVANLELRYPIYKKLGGTLFWDMGNVWSATRDFGPTNLRHSCGFGLRFNSPLGIARVDLGFKINRRAGESFGEVHVTLGQAF